MTAITVHPLSADFVAEIGDVDLSRPLGPAALDVIEQAFRKYAVLIFPGQSLSDDQHLAFARHFRPLETSIGVCRTDITLRARPELSDISNLTADGGIWAAAGRALIDELLAHATQRRFVHTHRWRVGDLFMCDDRCTLHRGTAYDDLRWKRDMLRATVSDELNTCVREGVGLPQEYLQATRAEAAR